MAFSHPLPASCNLFSALAAVLDPRSTWRLADLFVGAVIARGRRTVTAWIRAAGHSDDFRSCDTTVAAAGKKADLVAARLAREVVRPLVADSPRLVFALDDTPTPRSGPHVQGAGVHHHPTPGPTGSAFLYGHLWVVLAALVPHPLWGVAALPLLARLSVRNTDTGGIERPHRPAFRTKLELAADLMRWAKIWLGKAVQPLWVVADGAYAKKPFLKAVTALGVAARAAWMVSTGRLGARELRQLMPVSFGIAIRNTPGPTEHTGSQTSSPGQHVGRYKLGRLLGVGGSSSVFASHHPTVGIPIALKVVADSARAAVEAEVLTTVRHQNVVRLWDAGPSASGHFLALDYAKGGSLADRLTRNRPCPAGSVFRIARHVLRGLRASFRHGFSHGDVKPGNILRAANRTYVLADFGLAERLDGTGEPPDRVYGSWAYLAPERFHGQGDHRSDIYSLGLTLVHLLTGHPPVVAETFAAAHRAHRKLQLDPLHWTVAGFAREHSDMIRRMTAGDPADRPTDFTGLLAAFRGRTARAPESE